MKSSVVLLPRLIRHRDAPAYLGMDRNRFNSEVRPKLIEVPIGHQGVAFDRLELDAWVDEYKATKGQIQNSMGANTWEGSDRQVSSNARVSGTSTSGSAGGAFAKALAQVASKKPNAI